MSKRALLLLAARSRTRRSLVSILLMVQNSTHMVGKNLWARNQSYKSLDQAPPGVS